MTERSDKHLNAMENSLKEPVQDISKEDIFDEFYSEVKAIEKRDSVLTSKQQIERLTRPDSKNLNPFEVLQVDANVPFDEIKKKYKKLSLLVHPDKNPDDEERATRSFKAVGEAYKKLENEEGYKMYKEILEEAINSEVKVTEKRDSKTEIERLTRPGSTYFNLNPFEVLQVDPDVSFDEVKKKYRKLSLLVHPDKNPDDVERANKSFEAVDKAYRTLGDEEGYQRCKEIVEVARKRVAEETKAKKQQLKKQGKYIDGKDNQDEIKNSIYVTTCKLFADLERFRQQQMARESNEKKRKVKEDDEERERKKAKAEWDKNYEETRTERVDSWRGWNKTGKKAKGTFKPPKPKMEQR